MCIILKGISSLLKHTTNDNELVLWSATFDTSSVLEMRLIHKTKNLTVCYISNCKNSSCVLKIFMKQLQVVDASFIRKIVIESVIL